MKVMICQSIRNSKCKDSRSENIFQVDLKIDVIESKFDEI